MIKKIFILTIYNKENKPIKDFIFKNRQTAINYLEIHYNRYNLKFKIEEQERVRWI